ncbi:MAG: helix-turn-helix transcriptional regulator, partial [Ilumatobacteraceae bacterium]
MRPPLPLDPSSVGTWEFDAVRFARTLRSHRERLGHSTRSLARLARISQPYVVALERARTVGAAHGPTPTIDVTARLAAALHIEPEVLMRCALCRRGA